MLNELVIKNYALIQTLLLSPEPSLTIITGETGAGKSIILGAINLLLGHRADSNALLNKEQKCIIEGTFTINASSTKQLLEKEELSEGDECIIRREILPSGKSRAFVNDTPVRLDFLKELGSQLVDIHSQHETLLLQESDFQTTVLDAYAQNNAVVSDYKTTFKHYLKTKKELTALTAHIEEIRKEQDYHQFLYTELEEANLNPQDDALLETELQLVENTEDIKLKLSQATTTFSNDEIGAANQLHTIAHTLTSLQQFSSNFEILNERFNTTFTELNDIINELEDINEQLEYDPFKAEELKNRHTLINKLFLKHNVSSVEELITLQDNLALQLEGVNNSENQLTQLTNEVNQLYGQVVSLGETLQMRRKTAIPALEKEICTLLAPLGMPNAKLEIHCDALENPSNTGLNKISFKFSANKGIAVEEIKKVASGGEISRLMFTLKFLLAKVAAMPTIIFDEIDTGVSGEIALKMGKMMNEMSKKCQLITITHLPQVASKGKGHYFVYKSETEEQTRSALKKLDQEDRILEIAQMIGGTNPSISALNSAKELLGIANE